MKVTVQMDPVAFSGGVDYAQWHVTVLSRGIGLLLPEELHHRG
jgi:hypothetical protein